MPTLSPPAVPLTDGHVLLRPFTLDDVPAVTAACQDPEISRWTALIPWPYDEEHARSWISTHASLWERGEAAEWAVTAPGDGHLMGALGLRPFDWEERTVTAGYWMAASERNHGAATSALGLGVRWAFEALDLAVVTLVTKIGNIASERVAQKAGFSVVGETAHYAHPEAPDEHLHVKKWQTSAGEWARQPSVP
ncbi:MAG TPA: GNAT family N-acetyltransferase [Acidimicrobiales bacterium]